MRFQHISYANLVLSDSSIKIFLHDLVCVLDITKILISVFKLTYDNNVYFKFYPNTYCPVWVGE